MSHFLCVMHSYYLGDHHGIASLTKIKKVRSGDTPYIKVQIQVNSSYAN